MVCCLCNLIQAASATPTPIVAESNSSATAYKGQRKRECFRFSLLVKNTNSGAMRDVSPFFAIGENSNSGETLPKLVHGFQISLSV